ncbi:glycosyltransferase [Parabacteroides distasonis]|nr:glycosyltransferase [Parabacteroides distasonis]
MQRWDAIRYLILYRMGGMYVDFDYQSLERMENLSFRLQAHIR